MNDKKDDYNSIKEYIAKISGDEAFISSLSAEEIAAVILSLVRQQAKEIKDLEQQIKDLKKEEEETITPEQRASLSLLVDEMNKVKF